MASGTVWPPVNYSLFDESSELVYSDETIQANGSISGNAVATKANYYPLGVIGWSVIGSQSNKVSIARLYMSNKTEGQVTLTYFANNTADVALTAQSLRARILWIRVR